METLFCCATNRWGREKNYLDARKQRSASESEAVRPDPDCLAVQSGQECMAGWLLKSPRPSTASGRAQQWPAMKRFKPQWRRRYFVLTRLTSPSSNPDSPTEPPSQYQLYYYTDPSRSVVRGSISVDTVRGVATLIPPPLRQARTLSRAQRARLHHQLPFVSFECIQSHLGRTEKPRMFYLLADSLTEMQRWFDELVRASGTDSSATETTNDRNSAAFKDETDSGLGRRTLELQALSLEGYVNLQRCADGGGSSNSVDSMQSFSCEDAVAAPPTDPPAAAAASTYRQHYATLDMPSADAPSSFSESTRPTVELQQRRKDEDKLLYPEIDFLRTRALAEIGLSQKH